MNICNEVSKCIFLVELNLINIFEWKKYLYACTKMDNATKINFHVNPQKGGRLIQGACIFRPILGDNLASRLVRIVYLCASIYDSSSESPTRSRFWVFFMVDRFGMGFIYSGRCFFRLFFQFGDHRLRTWVSVGMRQASSFSDLHKISFQVCVKLCQITNNIVTFYTSRF